MLLWWLLALCAGVVCGTDSSSHGPAELWDGAAAAAARGSAAHDRLLAPRASCFAALLHGLGENGTCIAVLDSDDHEATQALRASVALSLTRCHYMASNRRMSGCMQHEEQVGDDCLSSMTDAEFSIYTAFLNGEQSKAAALRDSFRNWPFKHAQK